jgi:hypothetical protein
MGQGEQLKAVVAVGSVGVAGASRGGRVRGHSNLQQMGSSHCSSRVLGGATGLRGSAPHQPAASRMGCAASLLVAAAIHAHYIFALACHHVT